MAINTEFSKSLIVLLSIIILSTGVKPGPISSDFVISENLLNE